MARTALAAVVADRDGAAPAPVAAIVDGHMFVNNGRRMLYIENSTAAPLTVEIPFGATVEGQTVPPKVVTVPAAVAGKPGVQITGFYGGVYTRSDDMVWLNYPTPAGLSVAVIEPTQP